jgi:DNA polymerase-3 subunit delta'
MTATGWDRVVGQDAAVALLRSAATRPVHSYLLVGPRGSGVDDAARCFAAALIAGGDRRHGRRAPDETPLAASTRGDDDLRSWDLVLRGEHPDVVEIDPATNQIVVGDADRFVREAHASPIEGERKVVLLLGADRLNDVAANRLLKTIEEPPTRTHLVLVAERAERMLATIRSRCQRVDFAYLGESDVRQAIERMTTKEGDASGDPARIDLVARLAGGRVDRARELAGPLGTVRDAFLAAAESLDGTGAAVERAGQRVIDAVAEALAALEERQAEEVGALDAELAAAGYPSRVAQSRRRVLTDRQKRELRRARTDAWIEGITAVETLYRDTLAGADAPALNLDRRPPPVHPRAAGDALDACRRAREGLIEYNANETITLQRLLLHLPAAATVSRGP